MSSATEPSTARPATAARIDLEGYAVLVEQVEDHRVPQHARLRPLWSVAIHRDLALTEWVRRQRWPTCRSARTLRRCGPAAAPVARRVSGAVRTGVVQGR